MAVAVCNVDPDPNGEGHPGGRGVEGGGVPCSHMVSLYRG